MIKRSFVTWKRGNRRLYTAFMLAMIVALFVVPVTLPAPLPALGPQTALAHNLDQRMVYMFFDPGTQAILDNRVAGNDPLYLGPPNPLLRNGDEIGLIIKVIPTDGTDIGVGGYVDFYVPDGVEVIDAAYVLPDGAGGYTDIPMKGQAPMPSVGAGGDPVLNLTGIVRGPNILGVTSPIVNSANQNLGTLPGIYGDMGIFYSTNPDTAFDSWRKWWTTSFGGTAPLITNNSGDVIGTRTSTGQILNKWDAEQMLAYGSKSPAAPIVDSNGRGTAPWGMANVVPGPQSGYAWQFDLDAYFTAGGAIGPANDKNKVSTAMTLGPWQRIRYFGSQISDDPPGANPPVQPYTRGADGSNVGWTLNASNPLPAGTNTVRWAIGQLTINRPEWVRVKVRILDATAYYAYNNTVLTVTNQPLTTAGCPVFFADTFGGDAGGSSNGKDHLWRYYDPSDTAWNGCVAMGKPTDLAAVAVGQTFQYKIKFYNAGLTTLTNVVVKDTLPGGVSFTSAVPAQNSGPNPLTWNVGTLQPGQKFEALVTVKATSSGTLENCINVTSDQLPPQRECETITSGPIVILNPQKSATQSAVAPLGQVDYTVDVTNIGTATSSNPVTVSDILPTGFTYLASPAPTATVNGVNVTPAVNATNPNNPVFTIPAGIAAGKKLILKFSAQAGTEAGTYCNRYSVTQNGISVPSGLLACVNVGAAEIGDEVWRDWNGNGVRDPEDEGLPGVSMTLTPGAIPDTTDASGNYLFAGLNAGTYTVNVNQPSGYTQTFDPDGTLDNQHTTTLAQGQSYLLADFGYQPGGVGIIGDKVFDDKDSDGIFNNADVGIDNVTVTLFEDTNGDGEVDPVEDAQIAQTTSSGGGGYTFTGLAEGVNYIVRVDVADPDLASYFFATYGFNTYATTTPPSQQSLNLAGSDLERDFGFESVAPVAVGDEVFIDNNNNGVFDGGDEPIAGVTVQIFGDDNSNGEIDPGESLLATATTDGAGIYSADVAPGDYVARVRPNDPNLPGGISPSVGTIAFTLTTARDDIDFPYVRVLSKSVDKTSASANEILTYAIVPRYPGTELLTNVVVSDTIPNGTVYAGNDSPPATSEPSIDGTGTIVWTLGSNVAGTPGSTVGSIGSGSLTVNSSKDTWINDDSNSTNYGNDPLMRVDEGGGDDGTGQLLIQFSLPSLPPGASVTSAQLVLTQVSTSWTNGENATEIDVRRVTSAWNETTVTANNAPSVNGTTLTSQNVTTDGEYTWNITSLVQGWYLGTFSNFGVFMPGTSTGGETHDFATKENATASIRPRLVINYTGGVTGPATGTTLSAAPTLVTGGDSVQVTMALTASGAVANVTPGTLAVNDLNSAGANVNPANCGTAQLTSADDDIAGVNDPVTYAWTCTAQAGANVGNLTFSGAASGDSGSTTFAVATSNSVLVSPALSYQVKVIDPDISGLGEIVNTAYIRDATVIPPTESNKVTTTLPVGSIGDFIFYDNPTNPNGLPDPGEAGIPDVTVTLYRIVNGVPVLVGIETTDINGFYQFTNLPLGTYEVEAEEQQVNAPCDNAIPPQVPCNPAQTGRMVPTTGEQTFTLTTVNPNVTTADQGFIAGALLEGHVFHDVDHNGIFDGGEPGLPNVTVGLYDITCINPILDGSNQPITAQTSAGGEYDFLVAPGDYCVAYDVNDPNIPANLTETTTPTQIVVQNVTAGQERKNLDFGLDDPGRIGGTVYLDPTNQGVQDPSEPGIPGITVQLKDGNGNTIDSQAMGPDGEYLFVGLPTNSTYTVEVVVPLGYTSTVPNPSITSNVTPTNLNVNFGLDTVTVVLSGRVYDDLNNNSNDDGEPGFPNVDVTVVCSGTPYTVATGPNGNWSVSVPSGSDCTQISADGNDVPPTYQPNEIATPPGVVTSNVTGLDFGFVNTPGSITGTVCEVSGSGTAGNGTCQQTLDEPGIDGVTVTLRGAGPDGTIGTADDITKTTTTANGGVYVFTNLGPGLYQIVQTNLTFYDSVADVDGGNPDVINRMSGASIPLLAGEDAVGRDFEDALQGTPAFEIEKVLLGQDPFRPGDLLSFRIRITNTGDFPITVLGLKDEYNITYLTYVGSTPPSDDNINDGVINWTDLTTGAQVNGCGVDLAVDAVCEVVVDFVARLDTSLLQPDQKTVNTARTNGVRADTLVIPDDDSSARVQVTSPTSVLIVNRSVMVAGTDIILSWASTDESNIATYRLYRVLPDGTRVAVMEDAIVADFAGQPKGSSYEWVDADAELGMNYRYELEVTGLDGGVALVDLGAALTGERTYLPLVHRQ